jgi:hypothetical protein
MKQVGAASAKDRQVAVPAEGPRPVPVSQAAAHAQQPKPAPPKPAPKAGKEEAPPRMIITYACGCKIGAKYLQGSDCPACRNAKRRERPPRQRKPRADLRLPNSSEVQAIYDASTTSWTGSLSVPGCPAFESTASGIVPLLASLDRMFREWQASSQAPPEG